MAFILRSCGQSMVSLAFCLSMLTSLISTSSISPFSFTSRGSVAHFSPFTRVSLINEPCMLMSTDCSVPNSRCVLIPPHRTGLCKCNPGYSYDRKTDKCVRSVAIGSVCSESLECKIFDRHSYCNLAQIIQHRRPICACSPGYVYSSLGHGRCIHCRNIPNSCRDSSSSPSANSLAKYKFALLIKIILIVIGFSLLLSLTFCFFIKILNGYSKSRHSSARLNVRPIVPTALSATNQSTHSPPSAPLTNSSLLSSTPNRSLFISPSTPLTSRGNNTKADRLASFGINTNTHPNNNHAPFNEPRLLFASSSTEDKPPSYEEAVHGNIPSKCDLLISIDPKSPMNGNPV